MKYEIDGIDSKVIIKNYKIKRYYKFKNFKFVKQYKFKINFLKGKSGNLYTNNIEDIKDQIKITEEKMLKQLKELLKDESTTNNSALKFLERKLENFNTLSNVVTFTIPTIFMIKYENLLNLLLIIPNLLAKLYYTISLGIDWTEEFYKDVKKYQLYLDNKLLFDKEISSVDINTIDNYELESVQEIVDEIKNKDAKKLVKRR